MRARIGLMMAIWGVAGVAMGQGDADALPKAQPARVPADLATAEQWQAAGQQGAVAAGGPEAVAAGMQILKAGGNAADATVATILALSVTDANQFCFGGEVPILVYNAQRGTVEVIAGQGAAPRLATREFFATKPGGIPLVGIEPATVPAALDACLVLLERHGTKRFAEVAQPALGILDRHEFAWHADLARTLRFLIAAEATATERSQGLRRVADAFYRGPIAQAIDQWARKNGSLLRQIDLATHVTRVEDPVTASYRGLTVVKCGPWTQGPALLETLQILDGFDLKSQGSDSAEAIHLAVEALKLGLADRDAYYADPLFADVPLDRLLDPHYAARRRSLVDPQRASLEIRPGAPWRDEILLAPQETPTGPGGPGPDTTTCVVADGMGNVIAATPSGWSGVLAGDTGVWLGTRLQSFNTWAGHPNVIEPGKRPRITLTPTLVLKDGKPVMAMSVAGGDLQDQTMLNLVLQAVDFGKAPAEAVRAPRFSTEHHVGSFGQKPPVLGSLDLNEEYPPSVVETLKARGHNVQLRPGAIGAPVMLRIDPATRRIEAPGDPEAGRHADAY